MYFDTKPCRTCGAEVELRARRNLAEPTDGGSSEVPDGTVHADATVDERICSNPECPTNA